MKANRLMFISWSKKVRLKWIKTCRLRQLNQKISLSRNGKSNNTIDLEYSIKKLEDTGIAFKVDHVNELDMLVSFCINNFCK